MTTSEREREVCPTDHTATMSESEREVCPTDHAAREDLTRAAALEPDDPAVGRGAGGPGWEGGRRIMYRLPPPS